MKHLTLNINKDNRITCAAYVSYIGKDAIIVDSLPEGNITDYLYENGEYIYSPQTEAKLANAKLNKYNEISSICYKTITNGVDVKTSQGVEHFSLKETDQLNLSAAAQAIQQGASTYPYHADKQLCRMFSAEEIQAIVKASNWHKTYHTTLCNHLNIWINRAETIEEIESITYSAENLPDDLALNMTNILAES